MVRRLSVVCALAVGIAGSAAPSFANDRTLPMRFDLRQEAAVSCAAPCRLLISATGAITADTAIEFRNFAAGRNLQGATIVFDSDGGSVLGAIALGREIRDRKLATTVGRLIDAGPAKPGLVPATLSPRGDCESMCAFVLLAGTQRMVAPESRVMVHQIWLGDRREDPTAASYSAEDLVLVQRDIGRLAKYTADMGGPAELLELALRIPPWEPMHALTRDELRQMGFESRDNAPLPAPAPVVASIGFTPEPVAITADSLDERTWSMVDRGGASVLGRRHPLTLEGDEIGSFDLVVACSGEDGYLVTYKEARQTGGTQVSPLTEVSVRIGAQSAALKVVSSELRSQSGMLSTVASGAVPANLIKAFTAPGSHSLMIDTVAANMRTTIRVGNSGAHANLPVLAARCQRAATTRAELTPQRTGGSAQR
jgi:hypothetical protein